MDFGYGNRGCVVGIIRDNPTYKCVVLYDCKLVLGTKAVLGELSREFFVINSLWDAMVYIQDPP